MGNKQKNAQAQKVAAAANANNHVTYLSDSFSEQSIELLMQIFKMVDIDGNGVIDQEEVLALFKNANGRGSEALKYFTSMDLDNNGQIDMEEYVEFWKQVINSGVPEKAVCAELKTLLERLQLLTSINRLSSRPSTMLRREEVRNLP